MPIFDATDGVTSLALLFVTGTRADYGKLEPLALAAANAGHRVTFFVTGMHMLEKYGLTKEEVRKTGRFTIAEFINQRDGDPQDVILAKTVVGFSDFIIENNPDLVIVHGDRVEALACSLVCAMNYVRCAHIEGGEISGTIDELFRHCNTKLSTLHLVSSEAAKARVERLGESPERIHVIGSPELDIHGRPSGVTMSEVREHYNISAPEYGICIYHPVTSEVAEIGEQAQNLFDALVDSNKNFVVILPNNDPGSEKILSIIQELPSDRFRVLPSMRFAFFSELMRNAEAIVGNSSVGVREAPFLGLPSLDVGTRQRNRGGALSILNCRPSDREIIDRFLAEYWGRDFESSKSFGTGDAAAMFVELLSINTIWEIPLQKYFVE